MVYEIWALAIDYNVDDGYDDFKMGTFEEEEIAIWFFNNYPFKETPNTRYTLEKVEYDNEGGAHCVDVIAEKFCE